MLKESSNNNNKNVFSKTNSIAKEKMICKDGFCSLPNKKEIPKKDSNALRLAIIFLMANQDIAERLGKKARDSVISNFKMEIVNRSRT